MKARWDVSVDSETRRIIRGSLVVEADGSIEIRLPHRLESPNKLLHAHWRARTAEKKAWHARLRAVIADAAGLTSLATHHERELEALGLARATSHRRVVVERQVPSIRNFIKDRENLVYSVKHLLDQVRGFGFVRDDSMKWIDLDVCQRVSDDGRDWTVIRIEMTAEGQMPLMVEAVADKVRQRRRRAGSERSDH